MPRLVAQNRVCLVCCCAAACGSGACMWHSSRSIYFSINSRAELALFAQRHCAVLGPKLRGSCSWQHLQSALSDHGMVGVQEGSTLRLTNALRSGETVGDLDVLDGA